MKTILLYLLDLLLKKFISDNLRSFKVSPKRLRIIWKFKRRQAARYRINNPYLFDRADYIFDRSSKCCLYAIIILMGVLATISYFTSIENTLALQVFWFKLTFIFIAVILISFLPSIPKPERSAYTS